MIGMGAHERTAEAYDESYQRTRPDKPHESRRHSDPKRPRLASTAHTVYGPLQTQQAKPARLSASTGSKLRTPCSRSDDTESQRVAIHNRHNQHAADHCDAGRAHQWGGRGNVRAPGKVGPTPTTTPPPRARPACRLLPPAKRTTRNDATVAMATHTTQRRHQPHGPAQPGQPERAQTPPFGTAARSTNFPRPTTTKPKRARLSEAQATPIGRPFCCPAPAPAIRYGNTRRPHLA